MRVAIGVSAADLVTAFGDVLPNELFTAMTASGQVSGIRVNRRLVERLEPIMCLSAVG